jgi:imidazole glycerol phosphate synthase subunit HisF
VRGDGDCASIASHAPQNAEYHIAVVAVQRTCGFVCQDHCRFLYYEPGESKALLFTTAQPVHHLVSAASEAYGLQCVLVRSASTSFASSGSDGDTEVEIHTGILNKGVVLKQVAEGVAAEATLGWRPKRGDIPAINIDLPAANSFQ